MSNFVKVVDTSRRVRFFHCEDTTIETDKGTVEVSIVETVLVISDNYNGTGKSDYLLITCMDKEHNRLAQSVFMPSSNDVPSIDIDHENSSWLRQLMNTL